MRSLLGRTVCTRSLLVCGSFHFLDGDLCSMKVFNLVTSSLCVFFWVTCAFDVVFQKASWEPGP